MLRVATDFQLKKAILLNNKILFFIIKEQIDQSSKCRTKAKLYDYLARAVSSPEPDFGKAVVSDFVRSLSVVCPGLCPGLYGKSTGWIFMKFRTSFNVMV